jgi:two-component system sensor histidine kinase BaeS
VERLTRNTDINFDRQQRRTSWLIVALSTLLAALATFPLARGLLAPVKRLVEGTHKLAAGDFTTRVDTRSQDELGKLAQDFNQLASTLEKNQQMRRDFMADISTSCARRWRCCAASWRPFRTACASLRLNRWPLCRRRWARSPSWWTISTSSPCPTKARWPTRRRRWT